MPATQRSAAAKSLPSQLDEIGSVLSAIPSPLQSDTVPGVATRRWALTATTPALDWAALPAAVDADSTSMGVSTRKKTAKQLAKQRPVDQEKVQARVDRKRAQVESFLLVLQPLLEAAGHTVTLQQQPLTSDAEASAAGQKSTLHPLQQQLQPQPQEHSQHSHQQEQKQQQPLRLHLVDFGCGSGNLLLPLAALLRHCRFTGVDMKPAALKLLQQRAAAAGLTNVSVFEGMIEQYQEAFDVALALHACGNATDHVLQMAVDQRAAFVVSPCCVGKLRFSMTGGSSFHSQPIVWTPTQPGDRPVSQQQQQQQGDGSTPQQPANMQHSTQPAVSQQQQPAGMQQQQDEDDTEVGGGGPRLRHPRSDWLLSRLPDPERHFRIMAKVADMSHAPADRAELADALKHRASVADTCKRFVELDRCAAAAEAGYAVGLFKVLQADTMAKNDLLVGLPLPLPADTAAAGNADASAGVVDGVDSAVAATAGDAIAASAAGVAGKQRDLCLCCCGQDLASSGVLYTQERLAASTCRE